MFSEQGLIPIDMEAANIQSIIDQAKKLNHQIELIGHAKSGKEAIVYRVLLDGQPAAMKVYKNPEKRTFKNTGDYLLGKFYRESSHRKAIKKGNKFAKKLKHENWIKREFFMLQQLHKLGAKIPEPFLQIDNAILMQFLGDDENIAPRLCDIVLSKTEAQNVFDLIIKTVLIFWNFGIVHADLSAYNILYWNNEPYIIDFPQVIDRRNHPNSTEILNRDLKNIYQYFSKFIEIDFNELLNQFQLT